MQLNIEDLIKPENELEGRIIADPVFVEGCLFGKPRNGHPEGKVIYHIREVLDNVAKYANSTNRDDLRLVAIVHDSFKFKVDFSKPKTGENHHAMLARRFAEKYTETQRVLETIELHDEAYNSWQKGFRGDWIGAENRAKRLIARLATNIDFYLTFYKSDNKTGDKTLDNYEWFCNLVRNI